MFHFKDATIGEMASHSENIDVFGQELFFKHFPLLVFVEGTLYHIDELNEERVKIDSTDKEDEDDWSPEQFGAWNALVGALNQLKLTDGHIHDQLEQGRAYWLLERKLCKELAEKGASPPSISDAQRAISYKSFDYRLLNLLLYKVSARPYDDQLLEFLSASELLVEIGDDLVDYEEDVLGNAFNIYRMYVRIYGSDAPLRITEFISETEALHQKLIKLVPEYIQTLYKRRCEEAIQEEGILSGKWSIPPPIIDEDAYRVQCSQK